MAAFLFACALLPLSPGRGRSSAMDSIRRACGGRASGSTSLTCAPAGAMAFVPLGQPARAAARPRALGTSALSLRTLTVASPATTTRCAVKKPGERCVALRAESSSASMNSNEVSKFVKAIQTSTWLAWWAQMILSVVSAVTLFFANAVKGAAQANILSNGIFLAGIGLALSFVNIAWTMTYKSSAGKLAAAVEQGREIKFGGLSASIKVGIIIALSGMLITLIGAEQIVGTLVAKAVSGSLAYPQGMAMAAQASNMQLQAVDIFVVQANTNTLLSHLASLTCSLYIAARKPDQR